MYGKLFSQMYDGTLATKGPWQALVTFQQLIILADKNGVVDMTAESVSRRTTIPLEIILEGIAALEQPDADSRTPALDGRRIVRLSETRSWGWQIVNHAHYRAIRSQEERREYMRKYQAERRAKSVNSDVNIVSDVNLYSKQEAESNKTTLSDKSDVRPPKVDFQEPAKRVIDFLNLKTGKAYRHQPVNIDMIAARLREGASEQDCKSVIARKVRDWQNDDKMRQYLRPATLFNREKFANYVGELVAPQSNPWDGAK